jgi:CRISPR-associated protein Cas2
MRTRRMYLVIVYDIVEKEGEFKEKRKNRTKLYKRLRDFGAPVQYSVFEFNVTPAQKEEIMKVVSTYIEEGDRISIYTLCDECKKKIERLNTKPREEPISDDISSMEV